MDSLYHMVYDVRAGGFHVEWYWFSPLLVSAAALVRFHFADHRSKWPERPVSALVAVASVAMAVFPIRENYSAYRDLRRAVENGRYAVVEGAVQEFVPGLPEGHQNEQFRVGTHRFEYSPYLGLTGFRRLRAAGGPLREGLQVRIYDVNGTIARLDTATRNHRDLSPNVR
jgi:hypothetical protein